MIYLFISSNTTKTHCCNVTKYIYSSTAITANVSIPATLYFHFHTFCHIFKSFNLQSALKKNRH